jgi:hypothetical protein
MAGYTMERIRPPVLKGRWLNFDPADGNRWVLAVLAYLRGGSSS